MKLSEKTIAVLKSFSTINQSIKITPGNTLSTMHPMKTLLAKATIDDTFDRTFCIYELPRFLGTISLFKDPEIEIRDSDMVISSGRQKVIYRFCDQSLIVAAPEKDLAFPEPEVVFELDEANLSSVIKATGVLQLPEIAIVGEDGKLFARAVNTKDVGSDSFNIELGETNKVFTAVFKPEYITRLLNGSYKVELSSKKISRWTSDGVVYFIATEANSSF